MANCPEVTLVHLELRNIRIQAGNWPQNSENSKGPLKSKLWLSLLGKSGSVPEWKNPLLMGYLFVLASGRKLEGVRFSLPGFLLQMEDTKLSQRKAYKSIFWNLLKDGLWLSWKTQLVKISKTEKEIQCIVQLQNRNYLNRWSIVGAVSRHLQTANIESVIPTGESLIAEKIPAFKKNWIGDLVSYLEGTLRKLERVEAGSWELGGLGSLVEVGSGKLEVKRWEVGKIWTYFNLPVDKKLIC